MHTNETSEGGAVGSRRLPGGFGVGQLMGKPEQTRRAETLRSILKLLASKGRGSSDSPVINDFINLAFVRKPPWPSSPPQRAGLGPFIEPRARRFPENKVPRKGMAALHPFLPVLP